VLASDHEIVVAQDGMETWQALQAPNAARLAIPGLGHARADRPANLPQGAQFPGVYVRRT